MWWDGKLSGLSIHFQLQKTTIPSTPTTSRVSGLLTESHRSEVKRKYDAMDDRCKWKLSTGRYVEDVLYSIGKDFVSEK